MTWDWWRMDRGCPGREAAVVVVVGAGKKKDKQHRLVACSFVTIYITSNCPPVNSNKLNKISAVTLLCC